MAKIVPASISLKNGVDIRYRNIQVQIPCGGEA